MFGIGKRAGKPDGKRVAGRVAAGVKERIGFDSMLRNGCAYLGGDLWSASVVFTDVNYQLAPEAYQMEVIDRWARLINMFGANERMQVGAYTRTRAMDTILKDVLMGVRGDGLDVYREDYDRIVASRLESASRDAEVVKVLTVTIRETDRDRAVARLNRLANQVVAHMRAIDGCEANRLDRAHRLALLAEILRPGEPFSFSERDWSRKPGNPDVRDLVCPWTVDNRSRKQLHVESLGSGFWHRTLWVSDLPPELSDQLVNALCALRERVNVSIHLAPYDRGESRTIVRRKRAEVQMQVSGQRRKNIHDHVPSEEMPAALEEQRTQLDEMNAELGSTNQRLVDSLIVIGVSADDEQELDMACRTVAATVRAQACGVECLDYMQLDGLAAELPLGNNPLPMRRTLTTNSAAILIPFSAQEVMEPGGIYYGSNAQSGNPIIVDRRSHMNSNGFALATSGAGKSFMMKMEISGVFLRRDDEVIIIDPEHEYVPLAHAFGGQVIKVSAGSGVCVNPMDIMLEETGDGDPVRDKTASVVAMIGALIGGMDGLNAVERSLVDRAAGGLYARYRDQGGSMPQLGDLRDMLEVSGEPAGHQLAVALDAYVTGSLSGFNGQTNVDLSNRLTVFDVQDLTGELRTFGMMVIIDQIWNRVRANQRGGRRTWLYVDEFHRFFGNQYSSAQFKDLYKRARKYGLGVTGITQNVEELLDDEDARLMLSNSDTLMLLAQTPTDADALCDLLHLSAEQRNYFTGVQPGCGLLKTAGAVVPFDARIDEEGALYDLYSTSFDDGANR